MKYYQLFGSFNYDGEYSDIVNLIFKDRHVDFYKELNSINERLNWSVEIIKNKKKFFRFRFKLNKPINSINSKEFTFDKKPDHQRLKYIFHNRYNPNYLYYKINDYSFSISTEKLILYKKYIIPRIKRML